MRLFPLALILVLLLVFASAFSLSADSAVQPALITDPTLTPTPISPTPPPPTPTAIPTRTTEDLFDEAFQAFEDGNYAHSIEVYSAVIERGDYFPEYAYHNRGLGYANLENYDAAIADYTAAINIDTNYVTAYNSRGLAYEAIGDPEAALTDYNSALSIDPGFAFSLYNRAVIYFDRERYEDALIDLDGAIESDPNYSSAYLVRGILYERQGDWASSSADYRQWMLLEQTERIDLPLWPAGQDQDALTMTDGRVYAIPFEGVAGQMIEIVAGAPEGAVEVDTLIVLVDPNDMPLVGSDDFLPAVSSLISGYTLPLDGTYTILLGHAGGNPEGQVQIRLSLSEFALSAEEYFQRGNSNYNLGNYEAAVTDYSAAIEQNPENAEYYYWRARSYSRLENSEAAFADYNKALEIDPDYAFAYLSRGLTHDRLGDNTSATADFWQYVQRIQTASRRTPRWTPGEVRTFEMTQGRVYRIPFEAEAGKRLTISAESSGTQISTGALVVDPLIIVFGRDGQPLVSNDDFGGSLNARIENFELPTDGLYTLLLTHAGAGSEGMVEVSLEME